MKKVLMIAYLFPPAGGVKVQRISKFVKYLPHFGWRPIILTAKHPQHDFLDHDLLREIPKGIRVQRTLSFMPTKIYKSIRGIYRKLRDFLRSSRKTPKIDFSTLKRQSWALKLNSFIFIPDNRIGWWPFAFFNIIRNFKRNDFNLVYSTSPAFTSHLVGMAVKKIFKKPWVLDLRDLWISNPYLRSPTRLHLKISTSIERKAFRLADKIITVGEELCQDLIDNYPEIPSEKFLVIPNGYDHTDFEIKAKKNDKKFSISHVGSLYLFSGRTPYYFLKALGKLLKEFPDLKKDIKVTFMGPVDVQNRKILKNAISKYDMRDIIRPVDPMSHRESVKCIKSSDLLLLILGKEIQKDKTQVSRGYESTVLTGKLFEYLASGIPILALAGEGPVKKMIMDTNSGYVADPEDIEEIKKMVLFCFNLYRDGKLQTQQKRDIIRRFERKRLTGELAKIFDELSSEGR